MDDALRFVQAVTKIIRDIMLAVMLMLMRWRIKKVLHALFKSFPGPLLHSISRFRQALVAVWPVMELSYTIGGVQALL